MRKYGNKPTNGYASQREAKRANDLKMLECAGKIQNLREQVRYELVPKSGKDRAVTYIADFVFEENGVTRVEDVKGYSTPVYKLKKRLMKHVYGIDVQEV